MGVVEQEEPGVDSLRESAEGALNPLHQGLEFRVQGSRLRVEGVRFRVWCSNIGAASIRIEVQRRIRTEVQRQIQSLVEITEAARCKASQERLILQGNLGQVIGSVEIERVMGCVVEQEEPGVVSLRGSADLVPPPPGWAYRGTSLMRNCFLLGPYSRILPRALWCC